jgi:hypothetical protein
LKRDDGSIEVVSRALPIQYPRLVSNQNVFWFYGISATLATLIASVLSFFVQLLVKEKELGSKYQQILSGINISIYCILSALYV